jgi:hypothetical protein
MEKKIKFSKALLGELLDIYKERKIGACADDIEKKTDMIYDKLLAFRHEPAIPFTADECRDLYLTLQDVPKKFDKDVEDVFLQLGALKKAGNELRFNPAWIEEIKKR